MTTGRLAAAAFLAILLAPAIGQSGESPAAAFVAAVERFAEQHLPDSAWIGPESPWKPYLAKQFSDFLSDADRETSLSRQRVGECETVLTLEQQGFFSQQPDLVLAFGNPLVRSVFERYVVPQTSYGFQRCVAFSRLIPVIEATKRRSFQEETFTVNLPWLSIWRAPPHVAPDEAIRYREALRSLFTLAFCARFEPAITDVIDVEVDLHTNQLNYARLRLLEQLAREAKLDTAKLEQQVRYVRGMTPLHDVWLVDGLLLEQSSVAKRPLAPERVTRLCQE